MGPPLCLVVGDDPTCHGESGSVVPLLKTPKPSCRTWPKPGSKSFETKLSDYTCSANPSGGSGFEPVRKCSSSKNRYGQGEKRSSMSVDRGFCVFKEPREGLVRKQCVSQAWSSQDNYNIDPLSLGEGEANAPFAVHRVFRNFRAGSRRLAQSRGPPGL